MVRIKLLYFAAARELIGAREELVDLSEHEPVTTESLRSFLGVKYPHAASYIQDITLAVNLEYVMNGEIRDLKQDDEVALIPPISGG